MSNVITSFLVGVGFDYDDKGEKQIETGMSSITSKALQMGGVLAGAFGAKALTFDFANAKDELGKFAEVYGGTANEISALGRALEHEGGSETAIFGQLQNIENIRAGLLKGDASIFEDLAKSGIDPQTIINAESATEAYKALADQFASLSSKQRINAANALGFDDAAIRLLSGGATHLDNIISKEMEMRPATEEMTKAAKAFNDQWQDLDTNIGGFADTVSMSFLPAVTDVVSGINGWMDVNREFIGDHAAMVTAVVAGLGLISSAQKLAGKSSKIGKSLGKVTKFARGAGAVGLAGAAGYAVGGEIYDKGIAGTGFGDALGESIAKGMAFLGNENAQDAVDSNARERERASVERANQMLSGTISRDGGTPMKIESTVMLDGDVLGKAVTNINERNNKQALNDIETTIDG